MLEYASDLFDAASVTAMGERLIRLLEAVAARRRAADRHAAAAVGEPSATPCCGCGTTPRAGRAAAGGAGAAADAAAADAASAHPATLPALLAAQALRTPEAAAVLFEERRLSYAELEAHANALAHHLQSLGAGPETVVGLLLERSPEMVIGLIGILKAGAAYLPLDPNYPTERLAFMLEDAGAAVLVTQGALTDRLPATALSGATLVRLDADWPVIARQPATAPEPGLDPHHPAYVIYTSGSTGTPKGVVVEHGQIAARTAARSTIYADLPTTALLLLSSIAFDSSIAGTFWTLLSGGTLVLIVPTCQRKSALASNRAASVNVFWLCRRCTAAYGRKLRAGSARDASADHHRRAARRLPPTW